VGAMRRLLFFMVILLLAFTQTKPAQMSDYCYVPPFISNAVKPNVLIVMDFSGSMQFPAYVPCDFGGYSNYIAQCGSSYATYNPFQTYSGYFDPNKCYSYSSQNFVESNCDCSNKIGSSSCISGNLLNWISTTRIDIAKKVLTGGRTGQSQGNTFLVSEGAEYTVTDNNLKCKFIISANQTNNRQLTIRNSGGNCPLGNNDISNARLRIRPSDPSSIRGIIHSFCDTSDLINGQIDKKCQLIMEFMVFASDGRYGEIKVGKQATISDLINAINNETPYYGTPTGEAMWEAYDFYKQSNDHNYEANTAYIGSGNGNKDPYYDGSGQNSQPVHCRKSFVLLLSDGAWNGDVDPVVPARIMATQDLRSDLPGKQNVYTYAVYAFGDLDPNTKLQGRQAMITTAIFGGFEDKDNNTWPFPFTGIQYPNGSGYCSSLEYTIRTNIQTPTQTYCNSRGVQYPLPQCNPNSSWDSKCAEWDTAQPPKGLPYNFYEADDAESLKNDLLSAFSDILKRVSSGSTVATLSSKYQSSAVIIQPGFYPEYTTKEGSRIKWIGMFRAFWVDSVGNFREDSDQDRVLTIFGNVVDKIFRFFFGDNNNLKAALFEGDPDENQSACTNAQIKNMFEVIPTLYFDCKLAITSKDDRNIFYLIDNNGTLQERSFLSNQGCLNGWTSIDPSLTSQQCGYVIEYHRGQDYSGNYPGYVLRTRRLDVSELCPGYSPNSNTPWKLGPIVYSTPTVAGNEPLIRKYLITYKDESYEELVNGPQSGQPGGYKKRRSISFVSTNQGIIHFFRIGSLKETGNSWQPVKITNNPDTENQDQVEIEEYALIPKNALPYMLWYGHENYCSSSGYIPILDYRLDAFDATFYPGYDPNGSKTANSWRTYLFVPMGLGGKKLADNNGNIIASSSMMLIDITNYMANGQQPKVMWEITLDDGALTTAYPARVRIGDRNKNGYWYLITGSGPTDPNADSYDKFLSNPKLYIINPVNGQILKRIDLSSLLPANTKAAVGELIEFDVDSDYQDDVVYFGMYGYKSNGSSWGGLFRIALKIDENTYKKPDEITISDIKKVLDLDSFKTSNHTPPVFAAVSATKDKSQNLWVYVNTGLYLSVNHSQIPYDNYLIGFKDPCWNPVGKYFDSTCSIILSKNNFADANNVNGYANCDISVLNFTSSQIKKVCTCNQSGCTQKDAVISTNSQVDQCRLQDGKIGWYYKLEPPALSHSRPLVAFGIVLSAYFKPSQDVCTPIGETYVAALNYETGLPLANPPLVMPGNAESNKLKYSVFVGYGSPPLGEVFRYVSTPYGDRIIGQTSLGALINIQFQAKRQGRFVLWVEK